MISNVDDSKLLGLVHFSGVKQADSGDLTLPLLRCSERETLIGAGFGSRFCPEVNAPVHLSFSSADGWIGSYEADGKIRYTDPATAKALALEAGYEAYAYTTFLMLDEPIPAELGELSDKCAKAIGDFDSMLNVRSIDDKEELDAALEKFRASVNNGNSVTVNQSNKNGNVFVFGQGRNPADVAQVATKAAGRTTVKASGNNVVIGRPLSGNVTISQTIR